MKTSRAIINGRSLSLFLLIVSSGMITPAQTPTASSAEEARIRTASAELQHAELDKNLDKCLSFYADDASYFPPGATVIVGKDALRKGWAEFLATPWIKLKTTTTKVDVARAGDLAYEVGTYEMTMKGKDGKPENWKGKYVFVWKKQADGDWKIVVDIDNSDR